MNFKIMNHLNPRLAETETPISRTALCSHCKIRMHLNVSA